jgi:hypothetical protein
MVSQATKTREVTFIDIPKHSLFEDSCGCLYRKSGDRTGKLINPCMGCKIVAVFSQTKCVGTDFTIHFHERVTPVDAGPVRTAAPQPTEAPVEQPEQVVFAVVRFRIGIEKDVSLRRDLDDAKRDRDEMRSKDPVSSYLIEPRLLT